MSIVLYGPALALNQSEWLMPLFQRNIILFD